MATATQPQPPESEADIDIPGCGGWFVFGADDDMSPPGSGAGADPNQREGQRRPPGSRTLQQKPGDTNPKSEASQELKLSEWMAGTMVKKQVEKFSQPLQQQIDELKSRMDSGQPLVPGATPGVPSANADVRSAMDAMRRDVDSHREMFKNINAQFPALQADVSALRHEMQSLGSSSLSGGPGAGAGGVSLRQHEQAFSALQKEIRAVHQATQVAAVNAGLLAVTSAECSSEERAKLFQTLKAREQSMDPVSNGVIDPSWMPPLVGEVAARVSQGLPETSMSDARQDGARLSVKIEKVAGRPLGLQVDHENGSYLLVEAVLDGLVMEWNDTHPGQGILQNDVILAVNGQRGDADLMFQEIEKCNTLVFELVRGTP